MKCLASVFVLLSLVCLIAGCGPSGPAAPPTAKVSGTVNLDSKPMATGEVRFTADGQPTKTITVTDGAFSGEALIGKNRVEVISNKEVPNPSMPDTKMMVNTVSSKFSGPNSSLSADVPKEGKSDLKFDVTSGK